MAFSLFFAIAIIATCGLIYELVAGALASYLLGDSVTQFSLIIGIYLSSMGIGSWLTKYLDKKLIKYFVQVEFLVGIVGGLSAPILFLGFEWITAFRVLLFFFVVTVGILVGLEIPLMMRILKDRIEFKDLVARIFTFDYIGALFASLLFPLLFVPYLGLSRTSLFFGIINILVGLWTIKIFGEELEERQSLKLTGILSLILLFGVFIFSDKIESLGETAHYNAPIIYNKKSPYQKVVLTNNRGELRLFLNGNLQFSSNDEYRYHESLVHPLLATTFKKENILVLGGGDGLAVREILKYPEVKKITLVDLDPLMTKIFSENEMLVTLNEGALKNPMVKVLNADAFQWILTANEKYDAIVIDFPDPSNYSLGKLYSQTFFRKLTRVMKPETALVIQSTSPYYAKRSFWIINETIKSIGFNTIPYHAYVPSFGEWGFILASFKPLKTQLRLPSNLRFLTQDIFESMTFFPADMQVQEPDINKLNNQILVRSFEDEWSQYN